MSSSSASSKIGQCSICWSFLTSLNTFAITKCGHTFHQNCINQWITNAKNCPSCRTSASESDVIKLFIQEYVSNENAVAEPQNDLNNKEYIDFGRFIMSKCKCELRQDANGGIQYKCTNGVNVEYTKKDGVFKIILLGGYNIVTVPEMYLQIYRAKTKERSIVEPNGKRIEYFNNGMIDGCESFYIRNFKEEPITFRSDNDYVRNYGDYIKFYCPRFTVKRSLKNGNSGEFIVKVFSTTDSKKFLMIQACPRHQVFHVKHYDGNDQYCCASTEKSCRHLKNLF